jgi:tRNA A37 N6-isopentenylltransferase MiaA
MSGPLHFIAGSTGAGKTTYTKRLAAEIGGVCFAVDDWMATCALPSTTGWPNCFGRTRR